MTDEDDRQEVMVVEDGTTIVEMGNTCEFEEELESCWDCKIGGVDDEVETKAEEEFGVDNDKEDTIGGSCMLLHLCAL